MKRFLSSLVLAIYLLTLNPMYMFASTSTNTEVEKALNNIKQVLEENDKRMKEIPYYAEKLVKALEGGTVRLGDASVEIPSGALKEDKVIRIEALGVLKDESSDIANMTAMARGYRFLPSGTFEKDVVVRLPYASIMNSNEGRLDDLLTYYYNEKSSSWEALEKIGIEKDVCLVASRTNHFTDMMNGVLTIPETAKGLGVNINTLKSLKASLSSSYIPTMTIEGGNNQGSARSSLDIKVPNGINGHTPKVSIVYNSNTGVDLLGKGWSVNYGGSVDLLIKHGVPKWDGTEEWALNGEELLQANSAKPEAGVTRFVTKRGAGWSEIIRRQVAYSYLWEVKDGDGNKYTYGGTANSKIGSDPNATVYNITNETDQYGHSINYEYEKNGGYSYIKRITYGGDYQSNSSGQKNKTQKYSIDFSYIKSRTDERVSYRTGENITTSWILDKIDVKYGTNVLRTYKFTYDNSIGFAEENYLTKLTVINGANSDSYEYNFTYTTLENGKVFSDPILWGEKETGAPITTAKAKIQGASVAASGGVGIGLSFIDVHATGGGGGTFARGGESYSDGEMMDIDGDGRADYVWTDNDGGTLTIKYLRNLGDRYDSVIRHAYLKNGNTVDIKNKMNYTTSKSDSGSATGSLGVGTEAFPIGGDGVYSKTWYSGSSTQKNRFMDMDGDGRIDIVNTGWDYYLKNLGVDEKSNIIFEKTNMYAKGKDIPIDIADDPLTEEQKEKYDLETFVPHTPFKAWEAPYSGKIKITNSIQGAGSSFRNDSTDPVSAKVYIRNSYVEDKTLSVSNVTTTPTTTSSEINVTKGDYIYFIVDSGSDPLNTDVIWNIDIEYIDNNKIFSDTFIEALPFGIKEDSFNNSKVKYYPGFLTPEQFTIYTKQIVEGAPESSISEDVNISTNNPRQLYYDRLISHVVKNPTTGNFVFVFKDEEDAKDFFNNKLYAKDNKKNYYEISDELREKWLKENYTKYGTVGVPTKLIAEKDDKEDTSKEALKYYSVDFIGEEESVKNTDVAIENLGVMNGTITETKDVEGNITTSSSYSMVIGKIKSDNKEGLITFEQTDGVSNIKMDDDIKDLITSVNIKALTLNDIEVKLAINDGKDKVVIHLNGKEEKNETIIDNSTETVNDDNTQEGEEIPDGNEDDVTTKNVTSIYKNISYKIQRTNDVAYSSVYTLDKVEYTNENNETEETLTGLISENKTVEKNRFNSAEDYSTETGTDGFLVDNFVSGKTTDNSGNEVDINAQIEIGTTSLLYGGINNWFYGIWTKKLSNVSFSGDRLHPVIDGIDTGSLSSEEEVNSFMDRMNSEEFKEGMQNGSISIELNYTVPVPNKSGDSISAVNNAYVGNNLSKEGYEKALVGVVTTKNDKNYMTFISGDYIHSERVGGANYYDEISTASNDNSQNTSPDGRSLFKMTEISKVKTKGVGQAASLNLKIGGFNLSANIPSAADKLSSTYENISKEAEKGMDGKISNDTNILVKQNYQDMNGDGIPDQVTVGDNGELVVKLGDNANGKGDLTYGAYNKSFGSVSTRESLSYTKSQQQYYGAGVSGGYKGVGKHEVSKNGNLTGMTAYMGTLGAGLGFDYSKGTSTLNAGFMDINGDGLLDWYDGTEFYINTGNTLIKANNSFIRDIALHKQQSYSFAISTGLNGGANFDYDGTESSKWLINLPVLNVGFTYGASSDTTEVMFLDVNGDGLQDYVRMTTGSTTARVRFNKGTSFTSEKEITIPSWGNIVGDESFFKIRDAIYGKTNEFDTDGLNKEVVDGDPFGCVNEFGHKGNARKHANSLAWSEGMSLGGAGGGGFNFAIKCWLFPTPFYLHVTSALSTNGFGTSTVSSASVAMVDMDGDGYTDHVIRLPKEKATYWKRNLSGNIGYLKTVKNPQGSWTEAEYDGVLGTVKNPGYKKVVKSITYHDGCYNENGNKTGKYIEHTGKHTETTVYAYEGGYYDRNNKVYYGFEKVTTFSNVDNVDNTLTYDKLVETLKSTTEQKYTITTYFVDNYYSLGMTSSVEVYIGSEKLSETINTLVSGKPYVGKAVTRTWEKAKSGYAYVVVTEINEYSYDRYGNTTEIIKTYDNGETLRSIVEYDNDTSLGLIGRPTLTVVTDSNNNTIVRRDGKYGSTKGPSEISTYFDFGRKLTTKYEYNDDGLVKKVTNPSGSYTEFSYDDLGRITAITDYSLKENDFAKVTSDLISNSVIEYCFDYTSSENGKTDVSELDLRKRITDANGNYFQYEYDNWGRTTKVFTIYDLGPLDKDKQHEDTTVSLTSSLAFDGVPSVSYEYHQDANNLWYSITKNKVSFNGNNTSLVDESGNSYNDNTISVVVIEDALGNAYVTAKLGWDYNKNTNTSTLGWVMNGDNKYDNKGRVIESYKERFVEGESVDALLKSFKTVRNDNISTKYEYDKYDRVTKTTLPDGSQILKSYYMEEDNGKKYSVEVTTDAEGNITESKSDIFGNVVKTISTYYTDANKSNTDTRTAEYNYDISGNLISVKNNRGDIEAEYEYNMAGDVTRITTRDAGTTNFTYDDYGRILKYQTSALRELGEFVVNEYDAASRLIKVVYPETRLGMGNSVTIENTFGTKEGEIGYLVFTTISGDSYDTYRISTKYTYGLLGEKIREDKHIHRDGNHPAHGCSSYDSFADDIPRFTTMYQTNYLNQMEKVSYPNPVQQTPKYENDTLRYVEYKYDRTGSIKSIKGSFDEQPQTFVKDVLYDRFNSRVYIKYGNDVETKYSYDENRRWLNSILTERTLNDNLGYREHQNYEFTYNKNELLTTFRQNLGSDSLHNRYSMITNYSYDGLGQLLSTKSFTSFIKGISSDNVDDENYSDIGYVQNFEYDKIGNIISKTNTRIYLKPSGEEARIDGDIGKYYDSKFGDYSYSYEYDSSFIHRTSYIDTDDPNTRINFKYDKNGNISEEWLGHSENIVSNSRTLDVINSSTISYDGTLGVGDETIKKNNENIAENEGIYKAYTYDALNRIVSYTDNDDSHESRYVYDDNSERTVKITNLNSAQDRVTEINANSFYAAKYTKGESDDKKYSSDMLNIFIGAERICTVVGTPGGQYKPYYYHQDYVGTTGFITNEKGLQAERLEYTPSGEIWINQTSTEKDVSDIPYKFSGKEMDEETGMYYKENRYYNPQYNLYISTPSASNNVDKGKGGSIGPNSNPYSFAGNNPIRLASPNGSANAKVGSVGIGTIMSVDSAVSFGNGYINKMKIVTWNSFASQMWRGNEKNIIPPPPPFPEYVKIKQKVVTTVKEITPPPPPFPYYIPDPPPFPHYIPDPPPFPHYIPDPPPFPKYEKLKQKVVTTVKERISPSQSIISNDDSDSDSEISSISNNVPKEVSVSDIELSFRDEGKRNSLPKDNPPIKGIDNTSQKDDRSSNNSNSIGNVFKSLYHINRDTKKEYLRDIDYNNDEINL